MDASKISLSGDKKPVDAVHESAEQKIASPIPAVPKKAAPKVPDGYKIVKVRKPDGTIMKVLRPIAKDGAPSTSASTPKVSEPEKSSIVAPSPSVSQSPSKVLSQPAKEQTVLSGKPESQKVAVEKSSGTVTSEATTPKQKEATPKGTTAPPAHTSKLDAVSKSARVYRRFHRVHKHASRIVEAFDPYSDFGDFEEGDISMPDDSDDDSRHHSDDSDTNHEEHNHKLGSGSAPHAAATSTVHHAITNRPTPVAKETPTGVSVDEIPENKSTSTEHTKDALILEKEVLPANHKENVKIEEHGRRSLSRGATHWAKLIAWALVIVFPLAFIGLGIATACLDKKPTNVVRIWNSTGVYVPTTMSYVIPHATKAAITAWPIVFAAILAQTLKAAATYQVERGIRLRTLEQLIGSHSVSGAIKQPFVLRRIDWLTVGLMGLWALSPLGSQAMQYTTHQTKNIAVDHQDIYYLNTAQENPGVSGKFEAEDNYSDSMDVLYAAVFQQSTQFQPPGSDPWGNALIPVYEYLNPTNSSAPPTIENLKPTDTEDALSYASYYGIPLADFTEFDGAYSGTWNFTILSSYLYLDCPTLNFETSDQIDLDLQNYGMSLDQLSNDTTGSLYMDMTPPDKNNLVGSVTFVSNCSAVKTSDGTPKLAYAICNLSQTFVDSDISCLDSNCTVVNITKRTDQPQPYMYDFIEEFLKASDTGLSDYPYIGNSTFSMTELYIRDSSNATAPGAGNTCDLSSIDPVDFSRSLTFLMNTFYSTGFTHDYSVGSITPNKTITLSDGIPNSSFPFNLTRSALGTHTFQSDFAPVVFHIDRLFIVLFEFCAVMLLLIGILGILLESQTISPDILGFAANLARNSKYVKLPNADGPMSRAERAKMLGETRVMMQDIRAEAEVGKIVLGTVNESAQRLRPGRMYR